MDKRLTPARPDLAAAHLKDQVQAARYAQGEAQCVIAGLTALRAQPSDDAAQETQLLFGERFIVYDQHDGWAWGQAQSDSYVGYVREETLDSVFEPQARVSVLTAPVLSRPDVKAPLSGLLPLNAAVPKIAVEGDYIQVDQDAYVYARHLAALDERESDFVAVAERFLAAPYVWGGKTASGIDCSGLVQVALQACGLECPRDTDMQQAFFTADAPRTNLRRGDLVFWKGHVGVMLDDMRLLHANAHHMLVAVEPLADAVARIGNAAAIKRP